MYSYTKTQLQSTHGLSIYPAVIVSSLFAGSIADLITNPFWVIKTRIQTRALYDENRQRSYSTIKSSFVTMFQEVNFKVNKGKEGINGFYKGLLAQYLGLTHVFIYFPFYEFLLNYFKEKDQNSSSKSVFYSSTIAKCNSIKIISRRVNSLDLPSYCPPCNVYFLIISECKMRINENQIHY